jgi:hypothetical protein
MNSRSRVRTKNSVRAEILRRHNFKSGCEALNKIPWESMSEKVERALTSLLQGRDILRKVYREHLEKTDKAGKKSEMTFALDGRLVGDIGELIAAEVFCLELLGTRKEKIDAKTTSGPRRKIQIKATFKEDGLSIKHGRDYFIGLQFNDRGKFRVVYNGPAAPVMRYLKAPRSTGSRGRKHAGKRLESITLEAWAFLNLDVIEGNRISRGM